MPYGFTCINILFKYKLVTKKSILPYTLLELEVIEKYRLLSFAIFFSGPVSIMYPICRNYTLRGQILEVDMYLFICPNYSLTTG
jgi:hypothetical protein